MVRSDLGSRYDLMARYGIVIISGVLLYLATEQVFMLLWLGFYLITNFIYSWILWRTQGPVHLPEYARLVALNIVTSGSFTFMLLYLSLQDSVALQTIGVCGVAGHAMFNLSRHTMLTAIARWDTLSIVFSCIFMGVVHATRFEGELAQQALIAFGAVAVAGYYIVAQRSMLRTSAKLEQAREEAVQTQKMRALGQLTSGIAHDFNNLLTVMRGNVELAELAGSDDERISALQETKDAADRAARLISHMLAFSRKAHLRPNIIELPEFLTRFHQVATRVLPPNIQLDVDALSAPDQVCCDEAQLETALLHLATNARDAMAESGGRITLNATMLNPSALHKVTPLREDLKYVRLTLTDTGPGVSDEILSRIAEPFFTTKPVGQGSGLGLSMVKGFAEQSGGAALFATPRDGGLLVHLILPTGCDLTDPRAQA